LFKILDLRQIDVQCDLTPEQADRVAVGQTAEVRPGRPESRPLTGTVVFVGAAADQGSGWVPVRVRLKDAQGRLHCYYVPVTVRWRGVGR
jgi:hypothetical protein